MAELATLAPAAPLDATAPAADPGDRGSLTISARAVERIAAIAAQQVPAVLRRDATFGCGLPKARAILAGRRVRLAVEVAVGWGHPLADVAAEVRGQVAQTVTDLSGFGVDAVSVDISAVELPEPTVSTNRRRVE